VHLAFVAALAVATVMLIGAPTGSGDCCVPVAFLGVATLGELITVLIGIAVAGLTGRHSPLAIVDAIVTTPLVALVPSALRATPGTASALPLIVTALLILGLASAILAARVVREQSMERYVLGGALVLLAGFSSAVPISLVVPFVVLAALLLPDVELVRTQAPAPRGSSQPGGASQPRGSAARASAARAGGRRGAPDAAAVLGRRTREPAVPPDERDVPS
jgi:hypothetical protein